MCVKHIIAAKHRLERPLKESRFYHMLVIDLGEVTLMLLNLTFPKLKPQRAIHFTRLF